MRARTAILASCACLLGGIAIGRHTARAPDTIVDERAQETRQEAETVETSATVEAHVEEARAEERVIVRERVVYREGPVQVVEREVEASSSTAAAVATVQAQEVRVEVREVEVVREVERRVEVHTPLPDWRVGALVGVDLRAGFVYGGEVQYRIAGPVYVGAGALTSGTIVAALGFEFP